MAAKTIQEAIQLGLSGPLNGVHEHMAKQLRDFFAHEVMRMDAEMPGARLGIVTRAPSAKELFDRVFKDITATKRSGEKK